MKKANGRATDELRSEYRRSDFGRLVRGKYAARVAAETDVVVLEPELAEVFPNDAAVHEALWGLMDLAAATARRTSRSTRRTKKRCAG